MGDIYIHPTAEVSPKAKIGKGSKIWNLVQIREEAVLGKNCVLSKNVYIDKGVKLGNGVKVQNNVSIYHPAIISDDVFIGPSVTFTNDMYPRAFIWDASRVSPATKIKKGASVGANATLICGITLGEYSMAAAGSVVTKDVPAHALVMGVPAKIRGFVCKCGKPATLKKEGKKVSFYCAECKETFQVAKSDYLKMS